MTSRDEFSTTTKRTLAIRAAHFCSNPDCLKLTAGPHSDENRSLSTGHAAHIHAAAPDGPRYAPKQTPAERKAITNGLWLCRECGDIVDKDDAPHPPDVLRHWKRSHEAMIAEVRTKGYARSLELIQLNRLEPAFAKRVIALLEDRRALWAPFDAEFPDRVRHSLDNLRRQLADLRGGLPDESGMDQILLSLTKTIHIFFNEVERFDLSRLRCDSRDPEWLQFRDALATLRKSMGLQVNNLAAAYGIALSSDLQNVIPAPIATW
jgi:hypothetical protein